MKLNSFESLEILKQQMSEKSVEKKDSMPESNIGASQNNGLQDEYRKKKKEAEKAKLKSAKKQYKQEKIASSKSGEDSINSFDDLKHRFQTKEHEESKDIKVNIQEVVELPKGINQKKEIQHDVTKKEKKALRRQEIERERKEAEARREARNEQTRLELERIRNEKAEEERVRKEKIAEAKLPFEERVKRSGVLESKPQDGLDKITYQAILNVNRKIADKFNKWVEIKESIRKIEDEHKTIAKHGLGINNMTFAKAMDIFNMEKLPSLKKQLTIMEDSVINMLESKDERYLKEVDMIKEQERKEIMIKEKQRRDELVSAIISNSLDINIKEIDAWSNGEVEDLIHMSINDRLEAAKKRKELAREEYLTKAIIEDIDVPNEKIVTNELGSANKFQGNADTTLYQYQNALSQYLEQIDDTYYYGCIFFLENRKNKYRSIETIMCQYNSFDNVSEVILLFDELCSYGLLLDPQLKTLLFNKCATPIIANESWDIYRSISGHYNTVKKCIDSLNSTYQNKCKSVKTLFTYIDKLYFNNSGNPEILVEYRKRIADDQERIRKVYKEFYSVAINKGNNDAYSTNIANRCIELYDKSLSTDLGLRIRRTIFEIKAANELRTLRDKILEIDNKYLEYIKSKVYYKLLCLKGFYVGYTTWDEIAGKGCEVKRIGEEKNGLVGNLMFRSNFESEIVTNLKISDGIVPTEWIDLGFENRMLYDDTCALLYKLQLDFTEQYNKEQDFYVLTACSSDKCFVIKMIYFKSFTKGSLQIYNGHRLSSLKCKVVPYPEAEERSLLINQQKKIKYNSKIDTSFSNNNTKEMGSILSLKKDVFSNKCKKKSINELKSMLQFEQLCLDILNEKLDNKDCNFYLSQRIGIVNSVLREKVVEQEIEERKRKEQEEKERILRENEARQREQELKKTKLLNLLDKSNYLSSNDYNYYVSQAKAIGIFDDELISKILIRCSSYVKKSFFDQYVLDKIVEFVFIKGVSASSTNGTYKIFYAQLIAIYTSNWKYKVPLSSLEKLQYKSSEIRNVILPKRKTKRFNLDWTWVKFYYGRIEITIPINICPGLSVRTITHNYSGCDTSFSKYLLSVKWKFSVVVCTFSEGTLIMDFIALDNALKLLKEEYDRNHRYANNRFQSYGYGYGGGWPEKYGDEYVSAHDRSGHWRICASGKKVWVRACKVKGHNRHY